MQCQGGGGAVLTYGDDDNAGNASVSPRIARFGGREQTRTADLTLIRRVL
jgi:hypothetical protein